MTVYYKTSSHQHVTLRLSLQICCTVCLISCLTV